MMGEKHFEEFEPERLVKSSQRVRDLGEVFTPGGIVDDMLDLLPDSMWAVHPSPTFLEPSVGNGNFVSAILSRKLTLVDYWLATQVFSDVEKEKFAEFHALEALSSIYGVDISEDNIIGGTEGHEIACRPRLMEIMSRWHEATLFSKPGPDSNFIKSAAWITDHNMIVGNMLERDSSGNPTGRDELPVVEYEWLTDGFEVILRSTTLGDILAEAEESSSDLLSLFGPMPAERLWNGRFDGIHEAPHKAQKSLTGESASNARGSK
jgi:hypothetical protein